MPIPLLLLASALARGLEWGGRSHSPIDDLHDRVTRLEKQLQAKN